MKSLSTRSCDARRSSVRTSIRVGCAAAVLAFTCAVSPASPVGATRLVSATPAGAEGNAYSGRAVLSANGRVVVFNSQATNLVPGGTTAANHLFARDLKTGATQVADTIPGIAEGAVGTGNDFAASVSANGRFVSFESADDRGGGLFDVHVRDLKLGITTLVTGVNAQTPSGQDEGYNSALSGNGRLVAWTSYPGQSDIYVRDLRKGTTRLVSVNRTGSGPGNGPSDGARLSHNGRFVVFVSEATDLVAQNTNSRQVFVRDLSSGATELVSVNETGTGAGNGEAVEPSISASGRYVAFVSSSSDLVPGDGNGQSDVFVRDRKTGTTTLVNVNTTGSGGGNAHAIGSAISADGRYVAFSTAATDIAPLATNGQVHVFVRDVAGRSTTFVSVNAGGASGGNGDSTPPSISSGGRVVAFVSGATDLVDPATTQLRNVFARCLR